ncbi:MAG: LLM class F420-dependent oxidoreductase [Chloroflexi bacterium]|nr:LLM class F420-dependent oxidoreductase [Chloroflexota bacterium]
MTAPLRFGIVTPITTLLPRKRPSWEADGGPAEIRKIAIAADRLGYDYMTCSEHVGIPVPVAAIRGSRYYDPLATFGYCAALTERIRFLTHVIVLGYHHPLAVAKRYGTLDKMSGGRLMLGIGVGSLREEFELLGAEFERRAELYTDGLAALRAALGKREPAYHGPHYNFEGFVIDPCAVQQHVPIWLGGRTLLSLKRALRQADGWDPFGLNLEQVTAMVQQARKSPEWSKRAQPFDIALAHEAFYDITDRDQLAKFTDDIGKYQAVGATAINVGFKSRTVDHYLEQLDLFASQVAPKFR